MKLFKPFMILFMVVSTSAGALLSPRDAPLTTGPTTIRTHKPSPSPTMLHVSSVSSIAIHTNSANDLIITLPKDVIKTLKYALLQVHCPSTNHERRAPPTQETCRNRQAVAIIDGARRNGVATPLYLQTQRLTQAQLARVPNFLPGTALATLSEAIITYTQSLFPDLNRGQASFLAMVAVLTVFDIIHVGIGAQSWLVPARDLATNSPIVTTTGSAPKSSSVPKCPSNAPKGVNQPICEHDECNGINHRCTAGPWTHCSCSTLIKNVRIDVVDEEWFDFMVEGQKSIFNEIDKSIVCDYEGKKDELRKRHHPTLPSGNYCHCDDGFNYITMSSAPTQSACAYAAPTDLPDPLPPVPTNPAGKMIIRITETVTETNWPLLRTWEVRTTDGKAIGPTLPISSVESLLSDAGTRQFMGFLELTTIYITKSMNTFEKFNNAEWFKLDYMPIPGVVPTNATYSKSLITWSSNSADNSIPSSTLPGYGCPDLTKVPYEGPTDGKRTRIIDCWFVPVKYPKGLQGQ